MINKSDEIISRLKLDGHRITPARSKIVDLLTNSKEPLSAIDLIEAFHSVGMKVNKTTIYRELDFLIRNALLKEIEFGEGRKRYEIDTGHHHHLICINCKKIEDVDLKADLTAEEKRIEQETGFKVESHSLEFFGHCKNCRKTA